jgi:hypothetical protein
LSRAALAQDTTERGHRPGRGPVGVGSHALLDGEFQLDDDTVRRSAVGDDARRMAAA